MGSSSGRHSCVVGLQWGDEGKGKVVDFLAAGADVVVRYQGGANAGHTVKVGAKEYVFHQIPSGILQEGKACVIGNGVVLSPRALIEELDQLVESGLDRERNVWISERAHVVLPYHQALDAARERTETGGKIGTTLRGIGPCYTDKSSRLGIRMVDFVDPDRFRRLLERNVAIKNRELELFYGAPGVDLEAVWSEYSAYADRLRPRVRDITEFLYDADDAGATILFEGAQGALLDLDLGTYPYVTSSNTSFLGIGAGTGFSPRRVGTVYGIIKAYATRVGEGPFPSELETAAGDRLREAGGEFGATTGRARRCGWLDIVALRHTIRDGDVDALVITKLDVLDSLESIQVAVAYRRGAEAVERFPTLLDDEYKPVLRAFPGWKASTSACRSFEELPAAAREYLQFIATATGRPIAMVSVGKERSQTIPLDPWLVPRAKSGE